MKTGVTAALLSVASIAAAQTKPEIESIVREYILRHPEVLMESVRLHQERERTARLGRAKASISARRSELLEDPSSPAAGNLKDGVPVVAFIDYRCGYCKRVAATLRKLAEGTDARVVFKDLPILGPQSEIAARVALASHQQGAYMKVHRALMENSEPITPAWLDQLVARLELDAEKLKTDMQSPGVSDAIRRNQQLADAIGVQATPSFVVGSELASGALEAPALQALIEKARTQARASLR